MLLDSGGVKTLDAYMDVGVWWSKISPYCVCRRFVAYRSRFKGDCACPLPEYTGFFSVRRLAAGSTWWPGAKEVLIAVGSSPISVSCCSVGCSSWLARWNGVTSVNLGGATASIWSSVTNYGTDEGYRVRTRCVASVQLQERTSLASPMPS